RRARTRGEEQCCRILDRAATRSQSTGISGTSTTGYFQGKYSCNLRSWNRHLNPAVQGAFPPRSASALSACCGIVVYQVEDVMMDVAVEHLEEPLRHLPALETHGRFQRSRQCLAVIVKGRKNHCEAWSPFVTLDIVKHTHLPHAGEVQPHRH